MIIAATGHRPDKLGGYSPRTTLTLYRLAHSYLNSCKPSVVISGMAQGWDQAIAKAAIDLKIPMWAYIPFAGQEQPWPSAARLYYYELLKLTTKVEVIADSYSKMAMQLRNQKMVDDCELLVALWNGSDGGTANCIAYAEFIGRPYFNLWNSLNETSI